MREIKYRGRRIDNGEWAFGYYAAHKMMVTGEMDYFIIVNEQRPQSVDPETVGQYTGLKDKNGTEIYERDIVLNEDGQYGLVKWDDKAAGYYLDLYEIMGGAFLVGDMKVIGNEFQNPELLEVTA